MTKSFQSPWVPNFLFGANLVASRSRFAQSACESFLFKVMVSGQGFLDALPFHQQEAYGVAKRIAFVHSLTEKVKCLLMKLTIDPENFHTRVGEKARGKAKSRLARNLSDLGKSNELC